MTQDQIIQWAREAGIYPANPATCEMLTRFAQLVASHKQEQCAKVCEEHRFKSLGLASAIRALKD